MTIQELADAHVGHPEEIDEDLDITVQRNSFKCGAYKVLEMFQKIYDSESDIVQIVTKMHQKILELQDK